MRSRISRDLKLGARRDQIGHIDGDAGKDCQDHHEKQVQYRNRTGFVPGKRLLRFEHITDNIQKEITVFLAKVMETSLTEEQTYEVRSMIRVVDELESVADYCESLAKYQNRCAQEKIILSQEAMKDIHEMHKKIH